ncbi:unnamed protein product [Mytilus coruscus]|uniref:Uncharacterized protein n=1 Tax=Mytilus coruscus TaxID=42192 RepID=A0A6J8A2F6_MYTCO|nr:unnamed protein product [Mytilus coruscus]
MRLSGIKGGCGRTPQHTCVSNYRPKQKSRTRRKASPQNLADDVQDCNLVEEQQSQELPPIYRPPLRRRKARQEDHLNQLDRETPTQQQPAGPSANDIADALFLKFQNSGIQLVKDNTVVSINEVTGMLSSPRQPENSTTTDSQGPMFAVFQTLISSDPYFNTSSDGELLNSSESNEETPYACQMLRHSIPFDYHVSNKVKSDVWCDNYDNLSLLLPSNIDDTCNDSTLFENLNITISNRKPKKELFSIHQ